MVEFYCNKSDSCTIGINTTFINESGDIIIPEGDILIASLKDNYSTLLFEQINNGFMSTPILHAKMKSQFYEILSEILMYIHDQKHIGEKYSIIKTGIPPIKYRKNFQ